MQKKQKIQLDDLEKKQVYTVPDNYFENLPATIRRRLNTPQSNRHPAISWLSYTAGLAGLFLILLAAYAWFTYSPSREPEPFITDVAETEIIEYLQLQELSQYDIIEAASDAEITFGEAAFQQADINSELLMDETDYETIQDYI